MVSILPGFVVSFPAMVGSRCSKVGVILYVPRLGSLVWRGQVENSRREKNEDKDARSEGHSVRVRRHRSGGRRTRGTRSSSH